MKFYICLNLKLENHEKTIFVRIALIPRNSSTFAANLCVQSFVVRRKSSAPCTGRILPLRAFLFRDINAFYGTCIFRHKMVGCNRLKFWVPNLPRNCMAIYGGNVLFRWRMRDA